MRGDLAGLYDVHSGRLYSYCWSLVGDDAAAALRDTFVGAVRRPPHDDTVLWLHALAREVCLKRGTTDFRAAAGDPLLRAAGGLSAGHREALLLVAGGWLDVQDTARLLDIAPEEVRRLLAAARLQLERTVIELLMNGPASRHHQEIIEAFEQGALPRLLARRAPDRPPAELRETVLAACADEVAGPLSTMAASSPLVVIGPARSARPTRRRSAGMGVVTGVAASAAAAAGLFWVWPAASGSLTGGEGLSALPSATDEPSNVFTNSQRPITVSPTSPGGSPTSPEQRDGPFPTSTRSWPYGPPRLPGAPTKPGAPTAGKPTSPSHKPASPSGKPTSPSPSDPAPTSPETPGDQTSPSPTPSAPPASDETPTPSPAPSP